MNNLIKKYSNGTYNKKDLKRKISKNINTTVIDTGANARESYIKDEKRIRNDQKVIRDRERKR
ncbi:hypothetical protein [Aureivirga sp. CE67]|uniref:hypothetical protein n=1 Tax=Aureivirga sp. CE67 TaxID=1788983 RepID=UPI0018CB9607|nr:hypothetical protein [Aureivirga sp. CE67]